LSAVGRKQKYYIGFRHIAALLLDADHLVHGARCAYHGEAALAFDLQAFSNWFVRHSRAPQMQEHGSLTSGKFAQRPLSGCYGPLDQDRL
jgi:hypothetical protein